MRFIIHNNKKGDIATLLIFPIAVVLIVASLFYFASFDRNLGGTFKGFSYMSNEAEFAENYIRTENNLIAKDSALDKRVADKTTTNYFDAADVFSENANKRDLGYAGVGNYFTKIRADEYTFNKINCSGKIEHVFEMKGITYIITKLDDLGDGRFNENSEFRTFDICNIFDEAGALINDKCESAAKVMADCKTKAI